MKDYILSFEDVKQDLNDKLAKVREELKKAVDRMEAANIRAKAAEVQRDSIEAKYIELEVTSSIKINKFKAKLSDSNKEV